MYASLVRRQLSGLIPPKIATPSHLVRFFSPYPTAEVKLMSIFLARPVEVAKRSRRSLTSTPSCPKDLRQVRRVE
jgi:hypothetical protein